MKTALGLACVIVICIILTAGLWPFHSPVNNVTLSPGGSGLRFGEHGVVLSKLPVLTSSTSDSGGFSLEILLAPDSINQSATALAFSSPASPELLSVKQSNADLLLTCRGRKLYIDSIFRLMTPVFITMVGEGSDLLIYIDGSSPRTLRFPLSLSDLAGQIVIGTSPVENDHWYGQVKALAIYARPLAEQDVAEHFRRWAREPMREAPTDTNAIAVFSFGSTDGKTIPNGTPAGVSLYVPDRYMLLHEKRFEPFWREASLKWGFWKNVLINVFGFVPLGLVVCAFLSLNNTRHAFYATIAFGFAVSFSIELLQSYLPTRDSGTTDLITNTAGTALGALLCRRL